MKIGAGFLGHTTADMSIIDTVRAAQVCEDAGFDSFWVPDQRWNRDAWVALSAIATATETIGIGTRVSDPYVRHPALTAGLAASLDELSGGRFTLGLGAGGSGFREMGIRRDKPAQMLGESMDFIRALWGGRVEPSANGQLIPWNGGSLDYPVRADISIAVATRGPRLLHLCGAKADGVMVAAGVSEKALKWAIRLVNEGEADAGRTPGSVEILHQTYIGIDDEEPRRAVMAAKSAVVGVVVGSHPTYDFLRVVGLEVPGELRQYLANGGRERSEIVRLVPDSFVDALALAGTSAHVAAGLQRMHELGVDHPLLALIPVDESSAVDQLHLFIERVLPEVR